ncbi:unnamed protein product [Camellia sinensis]
MASETLEDKKQEEIANVEDKGEVKEEGKTEEGEEEKEAEKKEEDTEMAEKEEEEEEKEELEVKGEESKEEAEEVSKKAKRGRKGSSKKAAKDEKAAKSEPGSKEPVTPIERPIRERKTVERYSEPSTGRSASKALSIEKVVKAHSLRIYQMEIRKLDSWLIWNLTGGANNSLHVTDSSNAFDPSLSYEEREKRKRQAAERAVFLQDLLLIYGFASGNPLRFRRTAGHKDLFYIDDKDLDFKDVIEAPLPKTPLYTSIVCHWLAIEGVQPASPENAPVEAYRRSSVYGDDVVIVTAYRTALCKSKRGGFKDTYPDDLLAPVLRALRERTNLNPSEVGDVVETVPIRTVNRQCSSGLQAVADVAAAIKAGFYDIGIGAGLESMTANPMAWEGSVNPRIFLYLHEVETMAQHQDCLKR